MKKWQPVLWSLLCVGMMVMLSACSTVPYTERSRLMLTSPAEEAEMGLEFYTSYKKETPQCTDPNLNNALNRVAKNLIKAAEADGHHFDWEFVVSEDATANAFCVPGGKIAVLCGLFDYTANDAELATVVAHEIAHAIARHSGEQMSQSSSINTAGIVGIVAASLLGVSEETITLGAAAYSTAGQLGVILPYSREHEYEADYIGLLLMAKAGYDPQTAVTFWNKFGQDKAGASVMVYFSTHPMGTDRITAMKEHMHEANMNYLGSARLGVGEKITRSKPKAKASTLTSSTTSSSNFQAKLAPKAKSGTSTSKRSTKKK